ncbi:MAG: DUF3368 domain-containing protein [Cyanobacteria bacterium P01_G01_bin.54]
MIVVADTSPINYLLLIDQLDLLPRLFGQIILPDAVCAEMRDPDAPLALQRWIADPPDWMRTQIVPTLDPALYDLDPGEQAAITLSLTLLADLLLIDERLGRKAAQERGLRVIGIVGILDEAATQGWLDLDEAIIKLQATNFRISQQLIQRLKHNQR